MSESLLRTGAPPRRSGRGPLVDLAQARIERALRRRTRYRYVQPRVEREGDGWKIVSPNCSRNIDAAGGEIDIAWFVPDPDHGWQLHARDHAAGAWVPMARGLSLEAALALVCADPQREYWL
jgi:hypothetical protein